MSPVEDNPFENTAQNLQHIFSSSHHITEQNRNKNNRRL